MLFENLLEPDVGIVVERTEQARCSARRRRLELAVPAVVRNSLGRAPEQRKAVRQIVVHHGLIGMRREEHAVMLDGFAQALLLL